MDSQVIWSTYAQNSCYASNPFWDHTPFPSMPAQVMFNPSSSDFQALFDYLDSVSYASENSTTIDWPKEQSSPTRSPEEYFGPFQPPADDANRHLSLGGQENPISSPDTPRLSSSPSCKQSPSAVASPQTLHTNFIRREKPQHAYLLYNNFLASHQADQRDLLQRCLQSHWLREDEIEPDESPRRSILLGFLAQNLPMAALKCQFDACGKEFERQDRALGHIRTHLSHRPYRCNAQCGNPSCLEKFSCRSYLRSHLTREKGACNKCGKALFRQNMRRHAAKCTGSSYSE